MNVTASLILIILGVMMIIKPMKIWKIADSWKTKNKTEPTNYYLNLVRVGGLFLFAGGIAAIIELMI